MSGELIYTYDKITNQYSVLNVDIEYIEWLCDDYCTYCGALLQGDRCTSCQAVGQSAGEITNTAKVEIVGDLNHSQRLLKLGKNGMLYVCERTYSNYETMFELTTLIMEIRVVKLLKKSIGKMSSKMAADVEESAYFIRPSYNYYSDWEKEGRGDKPVVTVVMQCEIRIV